MTLSNSTFGNRYVHLAAPHLGVHALGGGIGQGVAMAVGAACAGEAAKVIALLGDGGTMVNLGELATAVDAGRISSFILMNDRGYGVIRNIQDAQFGGRRHYADLHTPDFGLICAAAFGLPHRARGAHRGFRERRSTARWRNPARNWSRSTWWPIGPFAGIVRRAAGRSLRQRMKRVAGHERCSPGCGSRFAAARSRISAASSSDEPLDLAGAALPNLDFTGATFNAPLAMRGAVFQGLAWFTAAVFNAPVDFSSALFLSDCAVRAGRVSSRSRHSRRPSSAASPVSTAPSSPMRPSSTA